MQNALELAVGLCCCLKICNCIINVVVMGLVLGQSFMVISGTGVLLCKGISLFNVLWECLCCYLHVSYIVYKYFDKSLHIGSSDPTCVQSFCDTGIQTEQEELEK